MVTRLLPRAQHLNRRYFSFAPSSLHEGTEGTHKFNKVVGRSFLKATKEEENLILRKQLQTWLLSPPPFPSPLPSPPSEPFLSLLVQSFTDPSFHSSAIHNFNLHSLGKSFTKAVLTQHLMRKYKGEKDVVNSLQKIVQHHTHPSLLFPIAKQLKIIPLVRYQLSAGTSHRKEEIIVSALHSLIASLNITFGTETPATLLLHFIARPSLDPTSSLSDLLQQIPMERLRSHFVIPPIYKVIEEDIIGENYSGKVEKKYRVGIYSDEKLLASEWSHDLYMAKLKAAEIALASLMK